MYEEKDGKFRLKVNGLPDVSGMRLKNDELLTEAKEAKKRLRAFEEQAEREKAELLAKSGDEGKAIRIANAAIKRRRVKP